MNMKNKVEYYTHGIAKIDVYFPEKEVNCRHCVFCKFNANFQTFSCVLTDDYISKDIYKSFSGATDHGKTD